MADGTFYPLWLNPWLPAIDIAMEVHKSIDSDFLKTDERHATEYIEGILQLLPKNFIVDPKRWSYLIYFPLAHAALVRYQDYKMAAGNDFMVQPKPKAPPAEKRKLKKKAE